MVKRSHCETVKRPVLKGWSAQHKCLYLYQPRCKQWACPYCASVNRSQWVIRVHDGVGLYQTLGTGNWMFMTITLHAKLKTRSQCLYVWPKNWSKLGMRLRRHYPGIRYVLLPELHDDGRVHVHALASGGVTTRWLKTHAPKCGLGYIDESERVNDPARAAWYAAKYLLKSKDVEDWPKGFRRIRTSQKWPPLINDLEFVKEDIDWEYYLTYDNEGLGYLGLMLEERLRVPVKVLES